MEQFVPRVIPLFPSLSFFQIYNGPDFGSNIIFWRLIMSERKETILMMLHGFGLAIAMVFSSVATILYIGGVISGITFAEGMVVAVLGIKGATRAYDMATDDI